MRLTRRSSLSPWASIGSCGLSTETNNPGNTRVEATTDRTLRLAALVRGGEALRGAASM